MTVKRKGTAYVRDFATGHRRKTIRDFPIQERERRTQKEGRTRTPYVRAAEEERVRDETH